MWKKDWLGIVLALVFLSAAAQAETVSVMQAKGKGVDEGTIESITELVRTAVTQKDGYSLVEGSEADLRLRPRVLRLGESYILKVDKIKGKAVVFSSKMKAQTLSDMDVVTGRVVRSVLDEESTDRTARVDDVTAEEETKGTRRYKATQQWAFGFGPAWSSDLNVKGAGTVFSLGYVWGLDPDFDLKLDWSVYAPREEDEDDAFFRNFNLGLNYFFSKSKTSSFLTAGVGYASVGASEGESNNNNLIDLSDDTASGWAATIGAGVKFFRTSTVNLGLVFESTHVFDKTKKTEKSPSRQSLFIVVYY